MLVIAISLLATVPVWIADYPPMTDLPQHASQISLLRSIHQPDFPHSQLFETNWFTPYLLGYMAAYVLVPVIGIVPALKVVIALAVLMFPIATAYLLREVECNEHWALLTVPTLFGFSYQWGFLNFIVAAPVGIAFLVAAIRHARRPTVRSAVALTVFAAFLFFCHIAVCAFFLFISVCYILAEARSIRQAFVAVLPLCVFLPFMAFWMHQTKQRPTVTSPNVWDIHAFFTEDPYYSNVAAWADTVHPSWGRLNGFFPRLFGVHPDLRFVVFGLLLFTLPLLAGARFQRRWPKWIALVVCAATLLFAPYIILSTAFTYQRFTMFAVPLFLMALTDDGSRSATLAKFCRWAAVGVALLWVGKVSVDVVKINAEERGFREMVSLMEPDQRALSLMFSRDTDFSIAPVFAHFPAWYSAQRGGVVDPNMALFPPELIVYRPKMIPRARVWDFEWNPGQFDWRRFQGDQYRYFVLKAPLAQKALFAKADCPVTLKFHSGEWWLFERAPDCPAPRKTSP